MPNNPPDFGRDFAVLRKRGIRTGRSSLWGFLDRHDITLEKRCKPLNGSALTSPARRSWIREQGLLDPARLVFLDETAVSTNMVRLKGRAPRGVRLIGEVPLGTWKTITFVPALRHNKMTAPMVVDGAMNGEIFLAYVEHCLVPTLRRGDIVVMDNPPTHKVAGIEEAVNCQGNASVSAEVLS